jgi:hypothetical protein
MAKLDEAWDNLFSFTAAGVAKGTNVVGGGAVETLKSQPSVLGRVLSTAVDTAAAVATGSKAAAPAMSTSSSGVTPEGKKKGFFARLSKS